MRAAVTGSGRIGRGVSASLRSFRPTALVGLFAWYRADQGVSRVGDAVSGWANWSGSADAGRHLAQSDPSAQPTFIASDPAYNGRSTIAFDGLFDFLDSGTFETPLAQPNWMVVVGNGSGNPGTVGEHFVDSAGTRQILRYTPDATNLEIFAGAVLVSATGSVPNTKSILRATFAGGASALYRGTTELAAGAAGAQSLTQLRVGINASGADGPLAGKIAEIILGAGTLNAFDIARLNAYLANRYGVPL